MGEKVTSRGGGAIVKHMARLDPRPGSDAGRFGGANMPDRHESISLPPSPARVPHAATGAPRRAPRRSGHHGGRYSDKSRQCAPVPRRCRAPLRPTGDGLAYGYGRVRGIVLLVTYKNLL